MLKAYGLESKLKKVQVTKAWHEILGKAVSNRTANLYFHEDTLIVKLNSSVLREELSQMRSAIIERLNAEVGQDVVKELVLK